MRTMERINKLTYLLPLLLAFLVIADHMPVEATHPDHVQIPASPRATHPDHVQIPASAKATHLDHVQLPASPKATYSDHDNVKGSCTPGSTHTKCSRPVTGDTKATLTLNSFQKGGSGGGPSECDGQYHSDDTLIVALSTGWYNNGARCFKFININGNGRSVRAMVVDECDTNRGCKNNIVDGSKAVWMALGVSPSDGKWGMMGVTWSDA